VSCADEAAQVIEELIGLAKENTGGQCARRGPWSFRRRSSLLRRPRSQRQRGKVLGENTLKMIARELVDTVRRNVIIDWTMRENVHAQLRVLVKRILRKYGYPWTSRSRPTQTVLQQAELMAHEGLLPNKPILKE